MDARQTRLVALLLAALVLLVWAYFETFASIVEKWDSDASFSHGFLIVPVSLWLTWRLRAELVQTPFAPSIAGALLAVPCVLAWVVARGSGILVVEQFAAVAMIPALVLAALGWPAVRVLLLPLAFLFLMVPFGRGLVPFLMQATADAATLLLQWTGIPVWRSHMYITIPDGRFEVARACSGLNYFVTSLVLGVLYAYLNYRGWRKRLLCVAAFLVFPVVLNTLRVYIIVVVSHLTEFRFGPGQEHVVFGRVFFLLVIFAMFWLGRRWRDDMSAAAVPAVTAQKGESAAWTRWWPLPVACAIVLSGPPFLVTSVEQSRAAIAQPASLVTLPPGTSGWRGPEAAAGRWRPEYRGGLVEQQAWYQDERDAPVDVFVAVYGLGVTMGAEMVSYQNVVSRQEIGSLPQQARRTVPLPDGGALVVRALTVSESGGERLVWHWYVVGDRPTASPYGAKILEAIAFLTRSSHSGRVLVLSTPADDGATQRLESYVATFGDCVAKGFQPQACRG
jgi:exosortase A